jgi:hypothetical protein
MKNKTIIPRQSSAVSFVAKKAKPPSHKIIPGYHQTLHQRPPGSLAKVEPNPRSAPTLREKAAKYPNQTAENQS